MENLKKKTNKNHFLTEIFSRTNTIHPGIFLGRALWADSVSPRMNTIASRDQFKQIRIGENLVLNYNARQQPASRLTLEHKRAGRSRETRKSLSWRLFTRLLPAGSLCSSPLAGYSQSVCLPVFAPYLPVSFIPLILICFSRKGQGNNSKTARFIYPLARL